jgi:hypothetical protein
MEKNEMPKTRFNDTSDGDIIFVDKNKSEDQNMKFPNPNTDPHGFMKAAETIDISNVEMDDVMELAYQFEVAKAEIEKLESSSDDEKNDDVNDDNIAIEAIAKNIEPENVGLFKRFVALLKGGPGSGRYPKGSGDESNNSDLERKKNKNEENTKKEFENWKNLKNNLEKFKNEKRDYSEAGRKERFAKEKEFFKNISETERKLESLFKEKEKINKDLLKIRDKELVDYFNSDKSDSIFLSLKQGSENLVLKSDEKQLVTGVVMEPEETDSQGEITSEEVIEKTCHEFMEQYQDIDLQHNGEVEKNCHIVESYIAPVDLNINNKKIKKGSWVMTVHVIDKSVWSDIKKGRYTGFSIGGFGIRQSAE